METWFLHTYHVLKLTNEILLAENNIGIDIHVFHKLFIAFICFCVFRAC